MKHIFLILAFFGLALTSLSAQAGEEGAKGGDPYVKLAAVAMPVRNASGVLVNYLFLTVRLNLAPKADLTKLRDKEPYFRDALLSTAYRIDLSVPGHDGRLDEARFKSVMMGEFAKIAGKGAIESIEVSDVNSKIHRQ